MKKAPNRPTWRATFRFPKPKPNQLLIRIPGPVEVQIIQQRANPPLYYAVEYTTGNPFPGDFPDLESAMRAIAAQWEEQLTPWTCYDAMGAIAAADQAAAGKVAAHGD